MPAVFMDSIDTTPANSRERKKVLYEFLRAVDQHFQVSTSRLAGLPSKLKIDFGGLFVANALQVYWEARAANASGSETAYEIYLVEWITGLVDILLNDILSTSPNESTALKQVLMMGLPPYAEEIPPLPTTERFITSLSSLAGIPDDQKKAFLSFLELHACVAALPLVVWLRDCVILLILQSSKENRIYNPRTRTIMFKIAHGFGLDSDAIRMWERSIGEILHGHGAVAESRASISQNTRVNQRIKIGLGAVGGAVILGVTGGLAFPILASLASGVGAALTGVGLGVVGTVFATTSVLLGSISVAGAVALFGITGGSLMTFKLANRFGDLDVDDFKFRRLGRDRKDDHASDALEVCICISGYLRTNRDFIEPWKCIRKRNGGLQDAFALEWERKNLASLGNVFIKLLSSELATALTNIYVQASLGAASVTATLPISVISAMADSDNIFIVCENRARQAGEALAEVITNEDFGTRPFTLIAYSVGASAVFSCLEFLAAKGCFACIQDVIIMGSTVPCTFLLDGQRTPWRSARSVVCGRFVNVYSKKDMLLQFLCRYIQWSIHVSGVTEVAETGIENVDVSDIIQSHSDYPAKIDTILSRIGYFT
jgi:hypothetical protein